MILVRHLAGDDDDVNRVVLLGRLERTDAAGLAAISRQLPPGAGEVRFVLSKLWPGGPGVGEALAELGRRLTAEGVPHNWAGAWPEISVALIGAGEGDHLIGLSPDDVRAGASWDGSPPQLPPARSAVEP